jgi:hypothetical protein
MTAQGIETKLRRTGHAEPTKHLLFLIEKQQKQIPPLGMTFSAVFHTR